MSCSPVAVAAAFVVRFSANVIMAVIAAVLCFLRFVSESEAEENDDISEMVRQMQEPFQNMES